MKRICKNCGKEIPDGVQFCPNCGKVLEPKLKTVSIKPRKAKKTDSTKNSDLSNGTKANETKSKKVSNQVEKAEPVENKEVNTLNDDGKSAEKGKKTYKKYLILAALAVIIVVALIFGYKKVYVPNVVNNALTENGFTSAKGYSVSISLSKYEIAIVANDNLISKYDDELAQNDYDTQRISVEKDLYQVADTISRKLNGKWKIGILMKDKNNYTVLWEYSGTDEIKRFQTTPAGRQLYEKQHESDYGNFLSLFGN